MRNYLARGLEVVDRSHLEPKTQENYRYAVTLVTPRLAALILDKLTSDHADRFFVALQATGGKRGKGGAARTAQNVRTILTIVFQHAVKKRRVAHNVFALSDPIPSKRERVEPFSEAEANRILDAAIGSNTASHRSGTISCASFASNKSEAFAPLAFAVGAALR